jgi:predicted nucleic acid-binding protein
VSRQVTYYERLAGLAGFFHRWRMLRFDDAAAQEFKRLRHERIRIGTADLKIAAIALTYQGTLLTSNLRDFDQVPGLRVEDWLYGCVLSADVRTAKNGYGGGRNEWRAMSGPTG